MYSTPRYPGAPHPTPRSTIRSATKGTQPPIHNPYDKFTQPQFDAWINDITGALKHALGHADAPTLSRRAHEPATEGEATEDETMEDSFAEVRARRIAKGKERAREEDLEDEDVVSREVENGWDEGEEYGSESDSEQSAEEAPKQREVEVVDLISSDDEEEEALEDQEEALEDEEVVAGPAPVYNDEDEDDGESGSEEEVIDPVPLDEAESDSESSPEEDDNVQGATLEDEYEDEDIGSESENEDGLAESAGEPQGPAPATVREVVEILDSDEEDDYGNEGEDEESTNRPTIAPRSIHKPAYTSSEFRAEDPQQEEDEEEEIDETEENEQGEEEVDPFPPRDRQPDTVEIDDPWRGPSTYAQDFYSGGDLPRGSRSDNPHILPAEEEDELVHDQPSQPPDIRDPWEGPRTFAEDFYAGGDRPLDSLTPSYLTPREEEPLVIPGITSSGDKVESPKAPSPETREVFDVDELYADVTASGPTPTSNVPVADEPMPEYGPSLPLAAVDWNFPAAFPGKKATGSGYLVVDPDEFVRFDLSYDEDQYSAVADGSSSKNTQQEGDMSTAQDSMSMENPAGFYPLDDLYNPGSTTPSLDTHLGFEPVSPGADFGDLPPSRGEYFPEFQRASSAKPETSQLHASLEREFIDIDALSAQESEVVAESTVAPDTQHVEETQETPAQGTLEAVIHEVDDVDGEPINSKEDIDVVSVPGNVLEVCSTEYVVEEVVTKGRRTEELEMDNVNTLEPDSNDQQQTQEDVEQTPREEETQTAVEHTESSSPLEFPAPVSADPTVPDPASLAPSPVAPASPGVDSIASSSNDFVTLPGSSLAPVGLLPAFRNIVAARSASGLFTPRTEYASGSATPEGQELEVAEEPDQKAESVLEAMLVEEEKSIQETEVVKEPEPFQKSETAQEPESVQEAKPAQETEPAQEAVSNWDGKDKVVTEETKPAEVIAVQVVDDEVVVNNAAPLATTTELAMGVVEPSLEVPVDEPAVQGSSALDVTQETLRAATPEPKDVVEHPAPRRHGTPGTDVDADAEGDLDPDYESSREEDIIEKSSAVPNKATSIDDDDPFIVNKEDAGSPSLLVEQKAAESLPTPVDSEPHADSTPHLVVSSETVDTSEAQDEPSATQETECVATDDTRPLKRKRKPSAAVLDMPVMRLTRSKTVKLSDSIVNNELELRKSRSGKGKGKQRARDDSDNDDAVSVAHSLASDATTAGSSTVADQLLIPEVGSRTSSRASSVASNAPSMYSQSSPTTVRTLATSGPNKLSPIPFMQDPNGGYRHTHRTKVPATSNVPERQPSRAPSNASEASHRSSVEPAPSQSSQPSQTQPARKPTRTAAHRTKPTPDSPVTRSHCRYHLISIPSEGAGAGRPLFFAVPGCSFSDAKLLKEEGIKDQGILVERDEVSQLILVLDDLKLPPATFAILRQLVGLDLLREHEVYYLPKPGDNVLHRSKRRRPAKPAQLESISARTSRGTNGGSASRSKDGKKAASTLTSTSFSMPPPSQASVSTSGGSGSYGRNGNPSVGGSAMGSSDLSDLDDDDVPPTKRIKESHSEAEGEDDHAEADNLNDEGEDDAHKPEDVIAPPEVPAVAQNGDGGANSEASTSTRRVPQPRRGRKLGVDAAAYKPTGGDSDGSDLEDNDDGPKKRRRGGKTRGVKRTRTDDSASTTGEVTSVSAAVERPKRRRVNAESGEAAADKPVD